MGKSNWMQVDDPRTGKFLVEVSQTHNVQAHCPILNCVIFVVTCLNARYHAYHFCKLVAAGTFVEP